MIPETASADILAPQTFAAEGERLRRVALLAGCAQQALNDNINAATIRLLQRHGCEVVIADGAGCCGSLPLHMGHEDEAKAFAKANVAAWMREPFDAVIVNASGCGTTVKDYGHLLGNEDARRIGGMTRDVTEIMAALGLKTPIVRGYRVAFHDPCSMQHGQKVTQEPRALLRAAGFKVVDVPEAHFCCGSAGTYNLLQPDMAEALGQRKAAHIESTAPDFVATGNIGCMTQLSRYLGKPVVHTAELLDWATGGPIPPALRDIPPPAPETPSAKNDQPAADAAFW